MPLSKQISGRLAKGQETGKINLSNQDISVVPPEVYDINNLTFGEKWWEVVGITVLDMSHNEIEDIHADIEKLAMELAVLDLNHNRLTHLPATITGLSNLRKLNVSHNNLTALPDELQFMSSLTELDCSSNHLTSLPASLTALQGLCFVNCSHNAIEVLPESLGARSRLLKLNVSHNRLSVIPDSIFGMSSLQELDLSHNVLSTFPTVPTGGLRELVRLLINDNKLISLPNLVACGKLAELVAGRNQMQELDVSVCELPMLQFLALDDNRLSSLPDEIGNLKTLTRLDLRNNDLTNLPPTLGLITTLNSVQLDGNPLRSIRRDIIARGTKELLKYLRTRLPEDPAGSTSSNLQRDAGYLDAQPIERVERTALASGEFDLSGRQLAEVPADSWERLEGVAAVNLCKNTLTSLPHQFASLTSLVRLDLSRNRFTEFPTAIFACTQLEVLNVSMNQLKGPIPAAMTTLTALREVKLSGNRGLHLPADLQLSSTLQEFTMSACALTQFPTGLYTCTRLRIIDLSDNQIAVIEPGFQNLTALESLNVTNNNIATLPPELGNMAEHLKALLVEGNPLKTIRRTVISKGTPALLEYLKMKIPV